MIQGIGTDIIEVKRIQEAIDKHGDRFLKRLFTEKEIAYCTKYKSQAMHFAGRFAAKEAVFKAFGTGLSKEISWKEIEIINDSAGKPQIHLSSQLLKRYPKAHILLSISHCKEYATAVAFLSSSDFSNKDG